MKTFKKFRKEDAPVNNVGGGNIAGLGVGAAGEPGIKKNNVMLKQVLDSLDKVDTLIDFSNTGTVAIPGVIVTEEKKPRKTFKQKYNVR
jgi:hypothetical protein